MEEVKQAEELKENLVETGEIASEKEDDSPTSAFMIRDKRFWKMEEDNSEAEDNHFPSYIMDLKKQIEKKEKQNQEYIAAYKSKMEENKAFRKRLEDDMQKRVEQAKGDILLSLLPLEDNLDRAISVAEDSKDINSFLEGIKMIQSSFRKQMKQIGLEPVEAVGRPFDPNTEEAIGIESVDKKEKDNQVLEEFERGYKIGTRLLRPAKVRVGKYTAKKKT